MLTNPLPHNQNMNLKSHDQSSDDDPPEGSGHGCINMVHAMKVVTHAKDYSSSQPSPGKEPDPPRSPLHIVARVLPLACANEHLLRRMDSLLVVQ